MWRQNLSGDLDNKLTQLNLRENGAEGAWDAFRDAVYRTALSRLGQNTRKHKDWFGENDEEIQKLLYEKHKSYRECQECSNSLSKKAAFNASKVKVQVKLREMQDSWLSKKADEIQQFADSNKSKQVYDALKTLYGPQSSGSAPLLRADGKTIH